jgi:hypothetical protein
VNDTAWIVVGLIVWGFLLLLLILGMLKAASDQDDQSETYYENTKDTHV